MAKRVAQKAVGDLSADSARSLKERCRPEDGRHPFFIGQSFRSNYCGVYSTGMLLSLLGLTTNRHQALGLFKLKRNNPDYPGASHVDIGTVFASAARVEYWRWEYHPGFDFQAVSQSLSRHLQISGRPTLLSFGAIHKDGQGKCTHVAVAIRATDNMIELLDPLASPPHLFESANLWLRPADRPQLVCVRGCSYTINYQSEAAILCWTARSHYAKKRNE